MLPDAVQRGVAVLGMKPFQGRGDPVHHGDVRLTPEQALRYAMSVPGVTTTITGMESLEMLRQNLAIARRFVPMDAAELRETVASVASQAGDGRFETSLLAQVSAHIATLGAFDTEADNGSDHRLAAPAAQWKPAVRAHLALAVDTTQHVGGDNPIRGQ